MVEQAGGGGGPAGRAVHRSGVQGAPPHLPSDLPIHLPTSPRVSPRISQVAVEIASRDEAAGKTVVVVFPSSAVRYMTHPLWASEKQVRTHPYIPPILL